MMARCTPDTPCATCGGTSGGLGDHGSHHLCYERAKRGQATPSLGAQCPTCKGAGTLGKGGVMLMLDLGPAAIERSIDAQFPPCEACAGRGTVPA